MRKFPMALLTFSLILLLGCCNFFPIPANPETTGMNVTVKDSNGLPIEGVTISLIGNANKYTGITDANGAYLFSDIVRGTYQIVISKDGYSNSSSFYTFNRTGVYTFSPSLYELSSTGLYGTITGMDKAPLENVSITFLGRIFNYSSATDENGNYNVTGIYPDTYTILVHKMGYKNVTLASFTVNGGYSYPWNITLIRDCLYYSEYTSADYELQYGFKGIVYKGRWRFTEDYPDGATYQVYPSVNSGLSQLSTTYQAGNRLMSWSLDNSKGRYSSISSYLYMNMNSTKTMELYDPRQMDISEAASEQPDYLSGEINGSGVALIDITNSEIVKIAQQVKDETGSNDTWTVAKALFVWLKNNTVYYINPDNSDYTNPPLVTLHTGKGKCDELSHLYISLLRADGIPSRFVKGYLIQKNPDSYSSHEWTEFYDGEWVPVEVAGSSGTLASEAATNFGVQKPNHIETFVDDGTDESLANENIGSGTYYDQPGSFKFNSFYDISEYDEKNIAVCSDGTRAFTEIGKYT